MTDRREHKRKVRGAFDRAAADYDRAAAVQREVCRRLAALAADLSPPPAPLRVLDAGCGTGYALELIRRLCPGATPIALDFAPAMLARIAHDRGVSTLPLCADLEALPLAGGSLDAIWSSLALQWCDPDVALAEFSRALRTGGVAWIATLGPRTLTELRDAFADIDDADHVIGFHARERWLDAASAAGFESLGDANPTVFALAPDLRALLHDIKAIGAHRVGAGKRRAPLGRAAWRRLEARYEAHRRPDGLLPATYDVVLLALRKR